jgi:hypothetical protein
MKAVTGLCQAFLRYFASSASTHLPQMAPNAKPMIAADGTSPNSESVSGPSATGISGQIAIGGSRSCSVLAVDLKPRGKISFNQILEPFDIISIKIDDVLA